MSTQRKEIYRGQVVDLGLETVSLPQQAPFDLEVIRHPGGAAVVALDEHRRVCLLRQYRHAGGGWLWELPAGKIDAQESDAGTARRELQEEAGVRAQRWQKLGSFLSTPGFCDERIHLYLARDLEPVAAQHQAHEFIEVHWLEFERALDWAHDGTIVDGKTLIGLLLAQRQVDP